MNAEPPVALFIFNRPECTRAVLAALRAARPARMFVVADGPRSRVAGDAGACAAARDVVARGIDWPCEVRREFADENLGCARRVASGLDWVFAQTDAAVILEDDCVPDATFLPFCAELLGRYAGDERVWHIGGANFQAEPRPGGYYFSRYNHVWGWAAWARSWRRFDWGMEDWPDVRDSTWLADLLGDRWAAGYWREAFDAVAAGRVDSWAYRWIYAMWRGGGLAALPGVNLVRNIGFGPNGTHTTGGDHGLSRAAAAMRFPLRHPERVERDAAADAHTERTVYSRGAAGAARRAASRWVRRWRGGEAEASR
ncbi:MAG TPA: hypothetical protein VHE13_02925 [Opitutus sp.]|nr:hypothetical protein [Opitutus sp.]